MQKIDPECYLIINAIEHEGQFDGQIIPQTQPNSLPWPEARLFVGLHAVQVVGNGWRLKGGRRGCRGLGWYLGAAGAARAEGG